MGYSFVFSQKGVVYSTPQGAEVDISLEDFIELIDNALKKK